MSISACMHGRHGRLFSLFLVVAMSSMVGCSQNETVEIDGFVRSIASPLGQECRETCDEVTTCVEVEYNCQTERYDCGWEWVGWFSIEYRCDERRVCDTREDCTVSLSNCREDCTRLAYPYADETPLLNALNSWSTDEIASRLRLDASVAADITEKRIDNGGVFFRIDEAQTGTFVPAAYKGNDSVQTEADSLTLFAPSVAYNNQVDLYIDGRETLPMILEMIEDADQYIHLNMMLFFDDYAGRRIANALKDAAQRGVILRVMFDQMTTTLASHAADAGGAVAGTPINPGLGVIDIIRSGCQAGVVCEVRSTSYETWALDHEWYTSARPRLADEGVPENFLEMQDAIQDVVETSLNVINHQKYMVVDGTHLLIGSSNFGHNYQFDEDFSDSVEWRWHDGMAKVVGPLAKHAQRIFTQQWVTSAGGSYFDFYDDFYFPSDDVLANLGGTTPMALMLSYPGDSKRLNRRHVVERIEHAEGDVLIENPYVTASYLWEAFNGLDAQKASRTYVVTPLTVTDSPTNGATVRCRGRTAVERGMKVYDFYDGTRFTHLKLTVDVDAEVVHYGSFNMNARSADHDLELNFVAKDPTLTKRAADVVYYDMAQATALDDVSTYYTWFETYFRPECWFEDVTNWAL